MDLDKSLILFLCTFSFWVAWISTWKCQKYMESSIYAGDQYWEASGKGNLWADLKGKRHGSLLLPGLVCYSFWEKHSPRHSVPHACSSSPIRSSLTWPPTWTVVHSVILSDVIFFLNVKVVQVNPSFYWGISLSNSSFWCTSLRLIIFGQDGMFQIYLAFYTTKTPICLNT